MLAKKGEIVVYRIKKVSDMPMSYSASLNLCHMCGYVGFKGVGYGKG
jgi:hypothetical protein